VALDAEKTCFLKGCRSVVLPLKKRFFN